MYVCHGERQRRKRLFLYFTFLHSFHICLLYVYVLELFISHLLHIRPWDIGKIFTEPMQSDSWENDSIMVGVVYSPCVMTKLMATWEHRERNLIRRKSEARSIQACSRARHNHVRNNQHPVCFCCPDGPSSHVHSHQQLRGPETCLTSTKFNDKTGYLSFAFQNDPCERSDLVSISTISKVIVFQNFYKWLLQKLFIWEFCDLPSLWWRFD